MIVRRFFAGLILFFLSSAAAVAQTPQKIEFEQEVLPNGLTVIYAPLHQAPVVHVRVLYHVGSRDERPDRQGFAHMFEHMMFRGSAHVAPQMHMKLINDVGGNCNATTGFDRTVYYETVPAENLDMCLYLEADRMSSFKVSDEMYKIERKVVAEEWRIQQNRPYGTLFENFLKTAFTTHSYRWTPIGNMQQLLDAPVSELQEFFNTYYVPNNAVLVIAGDIDVAAAKKSVQKYFSWIPAGNSVPRNEIPEPEQTSPRRTTMPDRVPLPDVVVGWHIPPYRSDDQYALSVLSAILGEGASSRLNKLLVSNEHPLCVSASTIYEPFEDGGVFGVVATVMAGKDAKAVETILNQSVADISANGITEAELAKAKTLRRVETIRGRATAEDIATDLSEEQLLGGDANRSNNDLAMLDAVTADDVKRIVETYLRPSSTTTLVVVPDPLGTLTRRAATAAAAISQDAPVATSTQPVKPRDVQFPAGYPTHPPMAPPQASAVFAKGVESTINGLQVVVMSDSRLPLVSWSVTLRRGSHSDPAGKEGLAGITADMLRHGSGKLSYEQLSEELESHGISLSVGDGGDYTRLSGSCTTEQLDRAVGLSRALLLQPTFPPDEFTKLKEQDLNGLRLSQENPASVAGQELMVELFGGTPLGHPATPKSVSNITLEDVKTFYKTVYKPNDAIIMVSGDVTLERGRQLAQTLTDGWTAGELPAVTYPAKPINTERKIILVDRPGAKASNINMGIGAYDIHNDEKYVGTLAQQILTNGIESRLNRYVRAEKGYVYGVHGGFAPGRHAGSFITWTETKVETTADTIEAIFKVFNDMRQENVTDDELTNAKRRVVGGMVMGMQTIFQQADYRIEGILSGYPIDYFDLYPQRVSVVTADQIRKLMNKYVKDSAMTIVVVGPASEALPQLQKLGTVEVRKMPAQREASATSQPAGSNDLLKTAG